VTTPDAGSVAAQRERLTVWGALQDLGWFPFLLAGIGGLSIIDLLEKAVFEGLSLITPFEILLEGYRRVVAVIAAIVWPPVDAVLSWLNELFNWDLYLHWLWEPVFVLGMVLTFAWFRRWWRKGTRVEAALRFCIYTLTNLVVALAFGLIGPFGDLNLDFIGIGLHVYSLIVVFFMLGNVALGWQLIRGGLDEREADNIKQGLAVLGGLIAAALLLLANWIVLMFA